MMGRIGKRRRPSWRKHAKQIQALVLEEQLKDFREHFGRDPLPGEPVFFDPDFDVPTPISEEKMAKMTMEAMAQADLPPEIAYAFKKTGMILLADYEYPPEAVAEYNAAIDEYFAIEEAGKKTDN